MRVEDLYRVTDTGTMVTITKDGFRWNCKFDDLPLYFMDCTIKCVSVIHNTLLIKAE